MSNKQKQNKSMKQRQGKAKKAQGQAKSNKRAMGRKETVPANQFVERPYREPMIKRTSNSKTCMGQEEFLVDVVGSVGFAVQQSFALNPGLASSFPWLSTQAQGWERYRFKKLNFRFTTSTGSTTPGTLIMSPDYDAADAAPSSQSVALTYKDREYCPPWCLDKLCMLNPAAMNAAYKEHYVRLGPLPANQDIKTFDVGVLHLCVTGGTAVTWGKLFVEYEVEFFNPQLPPGGASVVLGGRINGGGAATAANPLGVSATTVAGASGISVDALSNITFASPGTYMLSASISGTVLTAATLTAGAGAPVVALTDVVIVNAAGTSMLGTWSIVVANSNSVVSLAATATTVTAGAARVRIGSVPAGSL